MNPQSFSVISTGKIREGESLEQVKHRMADLFGVPEDKVERFLSGSSQVIRKNIDQQTALKYKQAIEKAGVICSLQEENPDQGLSLKIPEGPNKEDNDLPRCPKCGYQATSPADPLITMHDGQGECPACGIIVAKYLQKQAEEADRQEPEKENDSIEEPPPAISDDYIID
jgi:hypothetical protein